MAITRALELLLHKHGHVPFKYLLKNSEPAAQNSEKKNRKWFSRQPNRLTSRRYVLFVVFWVLNGSQFRNMQIIMNNNNQMALSKYLVPTKT